MTGSTEPIKSGNLDRNFESFLEAMKKRIMNILKAIVPLKLTS